MRDVDYRVIKTGLKTQQECDILNGVKGQLSDGMWENSRSARGYWPYFEAKFENGEVVLHISKDLYRDSYPNNQFCWMKDEEIRAWFAKKIKQVIKEEGLDWKRDNTEETDFLDTSWRKSKKPSTVADCYYVYEVLKGRNVAKHPEYASKMNISDALKTLDDAKIKYVQPEDEPWESDLDESAISWPLLSEAVLTPEQIEARRARRKARRERLKRINQPYYVKITAEGAAPSYIGYKDLATLQKSFGIIGGADLLAGKRIRYDVEDMAKLVSKDWVPPKILSQIEADLAKGEESSEHSRDW